MKHMVWSILLILSLAQAGSAEWFRGNTHAHTCFSDGDSFPADVVAWYRAHGYHFAVITDHNRSALVKKLNERFTVPGQFLVISGNEVTCRSERKPVHITAFNIGRPLSGKNRRTKRETLRTNIRRIRNAGAVPIICHPNDQVALNAADLTDAGGCNLIELWNQHPDVNNSGGGDRPSTEELWDILLSRGIRYYGIASDDMHVLRGRSPEMAIPGRGWICVWCERLSAEKIGAAMERGDFYASTGIELENIRYDGRTLTVLVKPDGRSWHRIEFIGETGGVLARKYTVRSEYRFTGKERYVRVRITGPDGKQAWTQPIFPGGPDPQPYTR